MSEQVATRDWYTRARVRVLETTTVANPEGGSRTFHAGQEYTMLQWGYAGRSVTIGRRAWWDSTDIDGAFIIDASLVEVIKVLEEEG